MAAILLQLSVWFEINCSFLTCIKARSCLILPAAESRAANLALFSVWHAEMLAMAVPFSWHNVAISDIFLEQEELAAASRLILSDASRIGPFSILPSNSDLNEFNFSSNSLPICTRSPCVADPGAVAAGSLSGE